MVRRVEEFVRAGDKYYQKKGSVNYKAALKQYGKAFSTADEKGMTGKLPDTLHKMGLCWQRQAESAEILVDAVRFAKHAIVNFGAALRMCKTTGEFKSADWVKKVTIEAFEAADFYLTKFFHKLKITLSVLFKQRHLLKISVGSRVMS